MNSYEGLYSYLQHVHHLPEVRGLDACSLLHGETLEVLDHAEAVDLGFLILQQLLQDDTIGTQDLGMCSGRGELT